MDTKKDCAKDNIEQITADVRDIHLLIKDIRRLLLTLAPQEAEQFDAVNVAQEMLVLWEGNEMNAVRKAFED